MGRRDPERKEPRLPPQSLPISDAEDPIPPGPRISTPKGEAGKEPPSQLAPSSSTSSMQSTAPITPSSRETTDGTAIGRLAALDTPSPADQDGPAGPKDPFGDEITSIGNGIAALLAEEANDPLPAKPGTPPTFQDFLTEAVNGSQPAEEDGSYSELQKRLITQIAEIMWFPKGTSETAREDRLIAAFDALVGIDPQDEVEGMLACQLIVTHRAALDCMRLSMAPSTAANDRTGIVDQVERLLAIYARNLAALDQHRARNKPKPAAFGKRKTAPCAAVLAQQDG